MISAIRNEKTDISLYDLLICLANAQDMVSHEIATHHRQVASLAYRIAEQMGLPMEERKDAVLASLLHDVGAFSLAERLALIELEPRNANDHASRGARLLAGYSPLSNVADIIRYHHMPWNNGEGKKDGLADVPMLSHLVHLADRIAVQVRRNEPVIGQVEGICKNISAQSGSRFVPEMVEAFLQISENEYIWLDTIYDPLMEILPSLRSFDPATLDFGEVVELTGLFVNIVDFRDSPTACHSAGVAKTAQKLAELIGFSPIECQMMLIAGNLHDLGKLTVDPNILNKPGKLDKEEQNVMRSHTYYTYRLLQTIKGFEHINQWASFHHEKLDGSGYPFHLHDSEISIGARVMAAADIFVAITEDRPYRKGMTLEQAAKVLENMVEANKICRYVVSVLTAHIQELDRTREEAEREARAKYAFVLQPEAQERA